VANADVLRVPDIEIIVNAGSFVATQVCFFQRESPDDTFDVVGSIHDVDEREVICTALSEAITFLRRDDWVTLDVACAFGDAGEDDPPF